MARHLVTGGAGYVGAFLVRELQRRGEMVRALDIADDKHLRCEFIVGDVCDSRLVERAMNGVDFVHHLAAQVPLRKSAADFQRVNVDGTRIVRDAALAAGVKHLSYMSSSAVCGVTPPEVRPIEEYGLSKAQAEAIIGETPANLSWSIIRPRTVLGPERLGIFQILFEWISEGRRVYTIGNGQNLFQFIHVDDVVEVSIETALKQKQGIFNVGAQRFGTLHSDLSELCARAATGSQVHAIPVGLAKAALFCADHLRLSPLAPWHYLTFHYPFHFDLKPVYERLEWRSKYSNSEMLWESYSWYLKNKSTVRTSALNSPHRRMVAQGMLKLLKTLS